MPFRPEAWGLLGCVLKVCAIHGCPSCSLSTLSSCRIHCCCSQVVAGEEEPKQQQQRFGGVWLTAPRSAWLVLLLLQQLPYNSALACMCGMGAGMLQAYCINPGAPAWVCPCEGSFLQAWCSCHAPTAAVWNP